MNLFNYDLEIENAFNEETGEIDTERINALTMERDEKIENLSMWVKELTAEAEAIKAEKLNLAKRQQTAEKKAESIRKYLSAYLDGRKFKSAKVAISYRKSEAVVIDSAETIPEDYMRYLEPEIDKSAIKTALKSGVQISGAHIEEKQNIVIK